MNLKSLYKSLILLVLTLFTINSANADFSFNNMELKFVQVSDTHICDSPDTSYKVLSHSKELLNSAIKDINKIKGVDFVVFTGDMVNEPQKAYYKDFLLELTRLKHPSILVFGNHDGYSIAPDETYLDKETVYKIIKRSNPFQDFANEDGTSSGGTGYFAYSPSDDYRVIVLDTTTGYENGSNGFLPDEQLNFLDNELSNNKEKTILIFQHHPVIEPFKSSTHRLLNANAYQEILKKYEKTPIAIFSGHYHAAKIRRRANVLHVSSPSLVTYPNAFRTITVTNYNDRVIFVFRFGETKLEKVQKISKSGIIATAMFAGTSADRNNEVMIRKWYIPKNTLTKEEKKMQKLEKQTQKEELKQQKRALKKEERANKKAKKEAKKADDIQD